MNKSVTIEVAPSNYNREVWAWVDKLKKYYHCPTGLLLTREQALTVVDDGLLDDVKRDNFCDAVINSSNDKPGQLMHKEQSKELRSMLRFMPSGVSAPLVFNMATGELPDGVYIWVW